LFFIFVFIHILRWCYKNSELPDYFRLYSQMWRRMF